MRRCKRAYQGICAEEGKRMNNPCDDCGKEICNSPDCFALKVYNAYLKGKAEEKRKKRTADRLISEYRYDMINKALKRGHWRKK